MNITPYKKEHFKTVLNLFKNTVRAVNSKDYDDFQIEAWVNVDEEIWRKRLAQQKTFLSWFETSCAGFVSLKDDGEIDLLFIHKDFQRRGVGSGLLKCVEEIAGQQKIKCLFANVSVTARPLLEKMGFEIIREQVIHSRGAKFKNYYVEKLLKI